MGFGALLLGVYDPTASLRYSGKVGTGFDDKTLATLRQKLDALEQRTPPFVNPPRGYAAKGAHWVKPKLVAEVAFTEWTAGRRVAPSVVSGPARGQESDRGSARAARRPLSRRRNETAGIARTAAARGERSTPARSAQRVCGASHRGGRQLVASRQVALSGREDSPSWISRTTTRRSAIGSLPHLRDRPLSLVRCPDGWKGECFYQKHADKSVNAAVDRVSSAGIERYGDLFGGRTRCSAGRAGAVGRDRAASVGFAEAEARSARPAHLRLRSGRRKCGWTRSREAAELLRDAARRARPRGFLKTTGGKGLHVVVPIRPTLDWDAGEGFTKADRRAARCNVSRSLHRDAVESETQRQDLHRLPAQRRRRHGGLRLLAARPGQCAGVDAYRVGGTARRRALRPLQCAQCPRAPEHTQIRPMARFSLGRADRYRGHAEAGRWLQVGQIRLAEGGLSYKEISGSPIGLLIAQA